MRRIRGRIRRWLALCLCLVILILEGSQLAYANEGVNQAVSVTFKPASGQETIRAGETGTMVLQANAAGATEEASAEIRIDLPEGVETYMPQFTADNNHTITVGENVQIQLLTDAETGAPYLQFTLQQGQTINTAISFVYPNGVTAPGEKIVIEEEDIQVTLNNMEGNVNKQVGTLSVAADFGWEDISKSESSSPVTADAAHHLSRDLTYRVTANSQNADNGSIFTKTVTITDTLTLPEGVTFAGNAGASIGGNNSAFTVSSGGTTVATIQPPTLADGITGQVISAMISDDRRTLTFTYKQTAAYTDASAYTQEMGNPNLTVTIHKDSVYIEDIEALDGNQIITNKVDFEAVPWVDGTPATSGASVETPIYSPATSIDLMKSSAAALVDGKMRLTYTIQVTNPSIVPLSNVTIRDTLPTQVEVVNSGGATRTAVESGQTVLYWENQSIPAGDTIYKTVTVDVKDGVSAGTKITNTAQARIDEGDWEKSSVTDTVISPQPNVSIYKSSDKGTSGSVYEGESITYTIRVENSGMGEATVNTTDPLPEQITNPRNYQYSYDGETWKSCNASYNSENHTITFPSYTLDNNGNTQYQRRVYLRFTGTVTNSADEREIVNTAVTTFENQRKESTTIVQVRTRNPQLLLSKQSGTSVETGTATDLYRIPYTLTIRNEGDETRDVDNVTATDIMSGGLMPEENPGNSGTITGTWTYGSTTRPITGTYQQNGDTYEITWDIPNMASGTSQNPSRATITYNGYIKVPANATETVISVSASNEAKLTYAGKGTGSVSTTTPMKEKPTMQKDIYSINGVRQADGTNSSAIHVGDTIVYRLQVSNTGTAATVATITDDLPTPYATSGFQWVLGQNVHANNGFGTPTMASGSNQIRWEDVRIPAGETLTCLVTLFFPGTGTEGGVEQFISAFVNSSGTRNLTNVMTMTARDPDDHTKLKVWCSTVKHTTRPTTLSLSKMVDPSDHSVMGGNEATFTLSGFGTSEAVANLRLVDDFSEVANYMSLTSIRTGSYSGISSYNLIVTYRDGTAITTPINNPGTNQTITANLTNAVSVTWDFGTVATLTVNEDPQLVMKALDNVRGNAVNHGTLHYNTRQARADATVRVTYSNILTKTAMCDGLPVDNDDHQLEPGDVVTFTISYKNMTDSDLVVNSANPLRDYLTVKGLEAGQIIVNGYVLDEYNHWVDNTVSPGTITISQNDINSNNAKRIDFTLAKPLKPGDTVVITYRVQVSDNFKNSQTDVNLGRDDSWEITSSNTAPNLTMLHNTVTAEQDKDNLRASTDFYYMDGENRVYFQKSVAGFSSLLKASSYGEGDLYWIKADRSTGSLSNWGASMQGVGTTIAGRGELDFVRYTILISNDINASEPLTISKIEDQLPANVFTGNYSGTLVDYSIFLNALYQTGGSYNPATLRRGNGLGSAGSGARIARNASGGVTATNQAVVGASTISDLTSVPSGYRAIGGRVSSNSYTNKTKVTFTVKNSDNTANLTLQPGEIFAFSYMVVVDRRVQVPQWDNTATLYTTKDMSAMTNPGYQTNLNSKNSNTVRNMADGKWIKSATYEATVSLYPPEYRLGITKTSAGKIEATYGQPVNWSDLSTGAASSLASIHDLHFGDVVCWDITLRNTGSGRVTGVTFTDSIPYPYSVVTSTGGTGSNSGSVAKRISTIGSGSSLGTSISGTVTAPSGSLGSTSQTLTISGITLNANSSVTFRIYARYNGDLTENNLYSMNYTNRAQFTSPGRVTVSQGNPVYDSSGTLVGASASASVFPTADGGSNAVKSVHEVGKSDNQASGNDPVNHIQIDPDGQARYTISVTNSSEEAYNNFVLIDKLPHTGDTGVVNASTSRGSQFDLNLLSDPQFEVELDGAALTAGTDYTIAYTTDTGSSGYDTTSWSGGGSTFNTTTASQNAKAFRLQLTDNVSFNANSTLTVSFTGAPASNAAPGSVAWNNFGYAYSTDTISRTYAEPARVGVQLTWDFSFTKVTSENTSTPLAGAEFKLYRLTGASTDALIDPDSPDSRWQLVGTLTSGADGKVTFDNLPAGEYRLVETKAPDGRIKPVGQWKLVFTSGKTTPTITAVGDTNPPAFIQLSGAYYLPNLKTVDFPTSGGVGMSVFGAVGTFLLGAGLMLGFHARRKKTRAQQEK